MTPERLEVLRRHCASITSLEELDGFRDGLRASREYEGAIVGLCIAREKALFRREPVRPLRKRGGA
ncbi:hypothetical protein [Roseinatronobacter bogoriensis]|nr:hypothetical protein [Rhodobaca bogoriensis]MBB4207260.1 hypothetical protein [Rhodobaca bogoriensis DSM 18756]TDY65759.1 hypothetical protein EV660_11727 [Rhodobaca bogoriensis DSM 18756]